MKTRLLMTTAVGLFLASSAFAQSQNDTRTTPSPSATQNRSSESSSPSPSSSSMGSPSAQSGSTSAKSSAETQAPRSNTTTSQSSPPNATGSSPASRAESDKNSGSSNAQRTDSSSGTSNVRSQSSAPANSSSQAQGNAPASSGSQAQQSPAGGANANRAAEQPNNANTNANRTAQQPNGANSNTTAQQPDNRTNTTQSPSSSVNASVNIGERERTRVSQSIERLNVRPLNNVNFSLSVGTVVPRDVHFEPLPADVVEIVPQYHGYDFLVVRDDIVVVEPSTHKIVDVIPRSGGSTASAPAPSQRKVTFSDRDREVIRKHARAHTESRTTGSATSTRVRVGDRLPDSVEVESFSDEDYRDAPVLREYRYIHRDDRTYVVEPQERRVIEEID
jgi:hypothetical protein